MTTKRYKPGRKESGVLGSTNAQRPCKTARGTLPAHTPVVQPHPSIPNVKREVCTGCGKVLRWLPA